MNKAKAKLAKRIQRRGKIRSRISGTAECPRLSVFKSNKDMYVQLIDDAKGITLACASMKDVKDVKKGEGKVAASAKIGAAVAAKAMEKKIEKVVFDRGGNRYHGRVKAVADGAREAGLKF